MSNMNEINRIWVFDNKKIGRIWLWLPENIFYGGSQASNASLKQ